MATDKQYPDLPEALQRAGIRSVRDNLPPEAEIEVSFVQFFQDEMAAAFLSPATKKRKDHA